MSQSVTAESLMHQPPVTVGADAMLGDVAHLLTEQRVGAAAVVAAGGSLLGMITERDVLRAVGEGRAPGSVRIAELMTKDPVAIQASESAASALEIFGRSPFRHLPVLRDGVVVGILSMRHVVRIAHIAEVTPAGSAPWLAPAGLQGVAVAETAVGDVRGEEGFFHYRGYDAAELARRCSFEEVWHLLIHGNLPDTVQLARFQERLRNLRRVPDGLDDVLRAIAQVPGGSPLRSLASAVTSLGNSLGLRPILDLTAAEIEGDCLALAALVPVLLARLESFRLGVSPVNPDPDLGYAAGYLQMLTGKRPSPEVARALEQYLILTMDHGFNASTFTARVITSTGADVAMAVAGAIGALSGPLHGGAPSRALAMLDEIERPERAEAYLRQEIEAGHRLMGFGHRVYKTDDPRSTLLREVAEEMGGDLARFAQLVEGTALEVLNELKPGRRLYTNVEFYAGVVMNSAGIGREMFTPTFACSRTVGWTAGIAEQAANNRIIRPDAIYVGPPAPRPLPEAYSRGATLRAVERSASAR